jgi:hypothetical protein
MPPSQYIEPPQQISNSNTPPPTRLSTITSVRRFPSLATCLLAPFFRFFEADPAFVLRGCGGGANSSSPSGAEMTASQSRQRNDRPAADSFSRYSRPHSGQTAWSTVRASTNGVNGQHHVLPHRAVQVDCADRRYPELVGTLCEGEVDLLLCPSGGMFGPESNDHFLQTRSEENEVPIVFVHPAEFLVTGPEGEIEARTILGNRLEIEAGDVGGEMDAKQVFYFDVITR